MIEPKDFEGLYTKIVISKIPDDGPLVDSLAAEGWILTDVLKCSEDIFVYWFQSKRKIYMQAKFKK